MSFGYSMIATTGQVAMGEAEEVFDPRNPRTGRCVVVLCHGAGNPHEFADPVSQPSSARLAAALASNGMPCIAGDFGGDTWGNDVSQTRIDAAWGILKTRYPAMRQDKMCLVAVSMGAAGAARYAQAHPERVAAMVGLIPLVDLTAFYQGNVLGTAAAVAAAWGVTSGQPLPDGSNVAGNAHLAASVPFLAGYSSVDTTVLPAWVTAYTAAVGGTAVVTDSTFGHSDAAVGGMSLTTLSQFLAANGA